MSGKITIRASGLFRAALRRLTKRRRRAALCASITAIDDWLNIYAEEHCDDRRVKEARLRIQASGGTLAYIARVQQANRDAL